MWLHEQARPMFVLSLSPATSRVEEREAFPRDCCGISVIADYDEITARGGALSVAAVPCSCAASPLLRRPPQAGEGGATPEAALPDLVASTLLHAPPLPGAPQPVVPHHAAGKRRGCRRRHATKEDPRGEPQEGFEGRTKLGRGSWRRCLEELPSGGRGVDAGRGRRRTW
jgi:hypothetical protein